MRLLTLSVLASAALMACQPRPRRPVDAGDAYVDDDDDAAMEAAAPDASDAAIDVYYYDTIVDRAPAPDVELNEAGGLVSGPQTPPQGKVALVPWIAEGHYLRWDCQTSAHPSPMFSGHTNTRVCLNTLWINTLPSQVFPVGAAAVKELWNSTRTAIVGFSVMVKVGPGNTAADWYWYQRVPADFVPPPMLPEPIQPDGTLADRVGTSGNALTICASCHSTAGEPMRPGHHFGFTTDVVNY
ncbi:MAG: hypothetical protein U0269_00715 [Polyangiales bacterium]